MCLPRVIRCHSTCVVLSSTCQHAGDRAWPSPFLPAPSKTNPPQPCRRRRRRQPTRTRVSISNSSTMSMKTGVGSKHQSPETTKMDDPSIERIYIGGLDPSRGLTVELVAARLCDVKDVEIHSINDVAINKCKEIQSKGQSIYNNSKRVVFDEDGDLLDTRNFFYVEACCVAGAAANSDANNKVVSALDLLSKQYNGVKWMGCTLRVEPARPHFLKRLEQERKVRDDDNRDPVHEPIQDDNTEQQLVEEKVIKNRRRLRIRKRFGEEAFHVDTLPHPIELRSGPDDVDLEGWKQFSTLHKRMHDKWQSQQRKLVERRKMERRLWASGKKIDPISATADKNDDLRSLMFLNRGIHVRFSDHDVPMKENRTSISQLDLPVESLSAPPSDTDDSSTHNDEDNNLRSATYVWSDDDDDDARSDDESSRDGADDNVAISEKHVAGKQYVWSDDEMEKDGSTNNSETHDMDITQQHGAQGSINRKFGKTLADGSEYTRAVAIDEFSGGMDFDSVPTPHDGGSVGSDSEGDDDLESANDEASHLCLDDDIRSNMDVLSQLFPDEHFDKKPLAASLTFGGGDDDSRNENVDKGDISCPTFGGGGLIMQRYDPTKEADKRFEMTRTNNESDNVAPSEDTHQEVNNEVTKDASVSSESSDEDEDEDETTQQTAMLHEKDSSGDPSDEQSTTTADAEFNTVPANDIYQQDKLEDIFNNSRNGVPDVSLGKLFQSEEQKADHVKSEVYEQGKLEDVFKRGRADVEQSGGFAFGFLSQPEVTTASKDSGHAPFSFGFVSSTDVPDLIQTSFEDSSNGCRLDTDSGKPVSTEQELGERPRNKQVKRKRYSEQELDIFEDLFFSLNEGPQILKDLDGMKQEPGNQELWQKERQILTADWKRKQKAALSRKGKKSRR
jgi:hypothetical protein